MPEPPALIAPPLAPSTVQVLRARPVEPQKHLKLAWRTLLARLRVDADASLASVLEDERGSA